MSSSTYRPPTPTSETTGSTAPPQPEYCKRVSPGPTSTGSTCHRGILLAIQCLLLIAVFRSTNQHESLMN
ncbi:unnamed protein product [Clonostachys rosea f. rosea IK726]|uniref:Uncharacterized protein n=1 Tax=Clonostachys rosea f. rosea IK726 TaxID=1349383 RepID=A0ACA9U0T0_BIOOC|nr:unnamed protein product [Clonostachys rosea f. rosea IK726]